MSPVIIDTVICVSKCVGLVKQYVKCHCFITLGQTKGSEKGSTDSSGESSSGAAASSSQSLPSFWIPSLTPEAKPTLIKKPVSYFSYRVRALVANSWSEGYMSSSVLHKGIEFIEDIEPYVLVATDFVCQKVEPLSNMHHCG